MILQGSMPCCLKATGHRFLPFMSRLAYRQTFMKEAQKTFVTLLTLSIRGNVASIVYFNEDPNAV